MGTGNRIIRSEGSIRIAIDDSFFVQISDFKSERVSGKDVIKQNIALAGDKNELNIRMAAAIKDNKVFIFIPPYLILFYHE